VETEALGCECVCEGFSPSGRKREGEVIGTAIISFTECYDLEPKSRRGCGHISGALDALAGRTRPTEAGGSLGTPLALIWLAVDLLDSFEREVLPRLDSTTASTASPLQLLLTDNAQSFQRNHSTLYRARSPRARDTFCPPHSTL
jgi:hypothetical protein